MKRGAIIALFLLFSHYAFAQKFGAISKQINVYIIPYGNEPFVVGYETPDYVRTHADFKFQIFSKNVIKKISSKIGELDNAKQYTGKRNEFNACNIVIDFVDGNSIQKSLAIADNFNYIIDTDNMADEVTVYKKNDALMCYLKSLFPMFIETNPTINNCQ